MRTLIIYCSNYGFSEKCANILKENGHNITLINLKFKKDISIDDFDTIILGGSIYAGKIQKQLKKYMKSNESKLLTKNLGLYICCKEESKVEEYFSKEFPQILYKHAYEKVHLGYAVNIDRMNFVMKKIMKKMAESIKVKEYINYENIGKLLKTNNANVKCR